MRIALIALGSRGDVQPYIALGKGLQAAGHTVRLVTHQDFEALAHEHELEFWPVKGSVREVIESTEMRALTEKGNFIAITLRMAREAQRAAVHWTRDSLIACQNVDLIIAGIGGLFVALGLAEKLEIPLLQAYLVPFTPTAAFPGVLLPVSLPRLGARLNRASHDLTRQAIWQGSRSADRAARREVLDLPVPPLRGPYGAERLGHYPVLYGFSPSVIPKPADWAENIHITGYWFLDETSAWTPPPALMEFLHSDPLPIYVGFGSMGNRKPEETTRLILQALAQTRQRAVILSGWGGLGRTALPDTVMMMDSVPHSWLFPRVAAVVHHGGAGTTAAGLRAGVPSIITPFFGDQPFWGRRVASLGAGPEPIPYKKLTVESLARAIQQVMTDSAMRQCASQIGKQIQDEDGIGRAVDVVRILEESRAA